MIFVDRVAIKRAVSLMLYTLTYDRAGGINHRVNKTVFWCCTSRCSSSYNIHVFKSMKAFVLIIMTKKARAEVVNSGLSWGKLTQFKTSVLEGSYCKEWSDGWELTTPTKRTGGDTCGDLTRGGWRGDLLNQDNIVSVCVCCDMCHLQTLHSSERERMKLIR